MHTHPQIPPRLAEWRVEGLLHEGSGGPLLSVSHGDRRRAIARLCAQDPGEAAPTLRHPRVLAVYERLELSGPWPFALIVEQGKGTDLHRLLQRRLKTRVPFAVDAALTIARDVCAGLVALSRGDVPAGAFNAGSVLIGPDGRARVLAWRIPSEAAHALGVLLFRMLCLSAPGDSAPPLSRLNPKVPRALEDLVAQLLSRELTALDAASERLAALAPLPSEAPVAGGSPKWFRDSVHGDMPFTGDEIALIDTPQFQRLRQIRQLGSTCLVYHDAIHTRFSHSLGAAFVVQHMMTDMAGRGEYRFSAEERRLIRSYALLHDVTHVPFGHTLEDERAVFARHDKNAARVRRLLVDSELGARLRELGLFDAMEAVMLHDDQGALEAGVPPFVRDLVESPVACDVLDYVRRDALFCGLSIGYDPRIFSLMTVREVGGEQRLVLDLCRKHLKRYDGLSEVVNLMRTRYFLWERVYAHHAKIRAGAMLSKAVELALTVDDPLREEELEHHGDDTLLFHLEHHPRFIDGGRASPWIQRLLTAYQRRTLYRTCYLLQHPERDDAQSRAVVRDLVQRFHEDQDARREAEAAIGRECGIPAEDLVIYCPAEGMASKRPQIPVLLSRDEPPVNLADVPNDELRTLSRNHRRLWTFYVLVHPEHEAKLPRLGEVCESVVGKPNQVRSVGGRGQLALPM